MQWYREGKKTKKIVCNCERKYMMKCDDGEGAGDNDGVSGF